MARRQRGFTLVELLVVISIIGTLMALLLPAVQAAREAARRAECTNSQKQIALALINYEGLHRNFPGYAQTVDGGKTAGWVMMVFPFMERKDIWDKFVAGTLPSSLPTVEALICASDPPETQGGAHLSYVGNGGSGYSGTGVTATASYKNPANGIFFDHIVSSDNPKPTKTNVDYVAAADGTAYTILISENIEALTWNLAEKKSTTANWWNTVTATQKLNSKERTTTITDNHARPTSWHPGGVIVAFADGHTHFLSESIDNAVYKQLMTSNSANSTDTTGATTLLDDSKY